VAAAPPLSNLADEVKQNSDQVAPGDGKHYLPSPADAALKGGATRATPTLKRGAVRTMGERDAQHGPVTTGAASPGRNERETRGGPQSPNHIQSPDAKLMRTIHARWGVALTAVCQYSSVPVEFIAALIANESGGDPTGPPRFEKNVFAKLKAVRDGRLNHYGSIVKHDLAGCKDADVRDFATSWGLTQIMGYHLLAWGQDPRDLLEPKFNLEICTRLLAGFCQRYQLDPYLEFEEMLRCWNTGHPYDDPKTKCVEGRTHDPNYVPNGLRRMALYAECSAGL